MRWVKTAKNTDFPPTNNRRQTYSYNERQTGSHIWAFNWYQFWWLWM